MIQLSKFWLLKIKSIVLCHVQLFGTPWTVARQTPSEFSREEYWSGLPFLSPGDLPYPWTEPGSPASQANSLPSELPGCFAISSFLVSAMFHSFLRIWGVFVPETKASWPGFPILGQTGDTLGPPWQGSAQLFWAPSHRRHRPVADFLYSWKS